jgi:PAS domain S-box-containing protein
MTRHTPSRDDAPPPDVLGETAALWEAIWRTTGEYVVIVDRAGTILDCNRIDDGFSRDHVMGRSFITFTTPDCSARLQDGLRKVFETGVPCSIESTVRRADGSLNYFLLRMGPVTVAGRTVAAVLCCECLLSLKESQKTLEHERHVLRQLLESQERERQVIAYEIHDGMSQYLAGAMMHFQALEHAAGLSPARDLVEGLRLLEAAAEESRRLIGGLRPPTLDELGIVESVDAIVREARLEIPTVTFTHTLPAERLASQLETAIFRIVQESLSNARRHAQASHARVTIERVDTATGPRIRVVVEDDGVGFDPDKVPPERFGLEGIRQRARVFGAEAAIRSLPGRGATVEVDLPVLLAADEANHRG